MKIKFIIRQLYKNKVYALISFLGLSVMLAVSLVIFAFVYHHKQFDKHIPGHDKAYRIISRIQNGTYWAATFGAFDEALENQPEIKEKTTFYTDENIHAVRANNTSFPVKTPLYVKKEFFPFFDITIIKGNTPDINNPNTAIITTKLAKKMFGDEDPVGKTIIPGENPEDDRVYTIVGIMKPKTQKSHLQFDVLLSSRGHYQNTVNYINAHKVFGAYVYVKLHNNHSGQDLQGKFESLVTPLINHSHGPPVNAFDFILQPLHEIHFSPGINRDFSTAVRNSHLIILFIIGLLLFIIATFNFYVMNIVFGESRRKHNWIAQFLGGKKRDLIKWRFIEISIIVLISAFLSLVFLYFLSPVLTLKFFHDWSVDFTSTNFWKILSFLCLFIILSATLVSAPVFVKSHKNYADTPNTGSLKHAIPLIILQFIVIVALIGFGIVVNKQIRYLSHKDLGYHSENIMILRSPEGQRSDKINVFRERVETIPGVIASGTAQHYPGYRLQNVNVKTRNQNIPLTFAMTDFNALDVLGIEITKEYSVNDEFNIFINKTFYNTLLRIYSEEEITSGSFMPPFEEDDTERFLFYVNGVTEDFHYHSLYNPIENFAFFVRRHDQFFHRFLLIRFEQQNVGSIMPQVKEYAESIYPGYTIEPEFLNDQLNQQYQSEHQLLSITKWFSVVTIIIACMGLLAFTMYSTQLKTKEIGIRKVNGAKIWEVMAMLNKNFIKWIAIAFLIATPIAWYGINRWLENFAYRTDLSWWVFALAGFIELGIALLTVSWQSYRAARKNPVKVLKYE